MLIALDWEHGDGVVQCRVDTDDTNQADRGMSCIHHAMDNNAAADTGPGPSIVPSSISCVKCVFDRLPWWLAGRSGAGGDRGFAEMQSPGR